jgi:hypothetical protein
MIAAHNLINWLESRGFSIAGTAHGVTITPGAVPDMLRESLRENSRDMARVLEIRQRLRLLGYAEGHPDHWIALRAAVKDPGYLAGLRHLPESGEPL